MRRIRFFYQLFFYFNYVTAPALILLPAWIANELLQHFAGGRGVAYMAHLGGLLTGEEGVDQQTDAQPGNGDDRGLGTLDE